MFGEVCIFETCSITSTTTSLPLTYHWKSHQDINKSHMATPHFTSLLWGQSLETSIHHGLLPLLDGLRMWARVCVHVSTGTREGEGWHPLPTLPGHRYQDFMEINISSFSHLPQKAQTQTLPQVCRVGIIHDENGNEPGA